MEVITDFENEYEFLSNFYECSVTFEGLTYGSSEAAFQAEPGLDGEIACDKTGSLS